MRKIDPVPTRDDAGPASCREARRTAARARIACERSRIIITWSREIIAASHQLIDDSTALPAERAADGPHRNPVELTHG